MSKARDIASAAPAPAGVTSTELGYVDGVTSAIQTQVDAKIAKTLTTTTGDIIYASGANTPARLGVGSTGNVLTVSGGVPAWAAPASSGGMTLINAGGTALNTGGTTTTISSIPSTYTNLFIVVDNWWPATDGAVLRMNLNSQATTYSAIYQRVRADQALNNGYQTTTELFEYGTDNTEKNNIAVATIYEYANTSCYKLFNSKSGFREANNNKALGFSQFVYESTDAVSSLAFVTSSGNSAGGTVFVYGVK